MEKFVTDWFEESKKKSKIAHSPEYLAWIDDIVTKINNISRKYLEYKVLNLY